MDHRQAGGYGFLLGNLAVIANGLIAYLLGDTEKTKKAGLNRLGTGVLWNGGAFVLARFGNQPVPRQLERMQHKLAAYLEQEGVPLDAETLRKADEEKRRGWFQKIEDFLYNYPIECNNVYNTVVSAGIVRSGFIRRSEGKMESGNMNIACGSLVLGGTLASIIIPEKTPEQIAAKGQAGTLWGKLQKRPLSYAVWLFIASDLTEGVGAHGEYKNAMALPKDHAFRPWAFAMSALSAVAMVCFVTADSLTGFGSKKAGGKPEDRQDAQEQIINEAAKILAAQPAEARDALIQKTVEYMVKQPELRMGDRDPAAMQQQILDTIQERAGRAELPETQGLHTTKLAENNAKYASAAQSF